MSDGLNQVTLLGNLGADPELRHAHNGNPVLSMRLATSRGYIDTNQVRQERTEWHNVSVWGKRAEALARFLSRGARVAIVGELRYSKYVDKNGEDKWRTDIVARDVVLCGGGKRDESGNASSPPRGAGASAGGYDQGNGEGYEYPGGDDDIPF